MPLGRLPRTSPSSRPGAPAAAIAVVAACVGGRWTLTDPESNNVLVAGVSTAFLRREIAAGRLDLDAGWDVGAPADVPRAGAW